ncbi:MAG: sulfatase-like hydrolase/transferase [Gemmatimonadota bacterium]|nr:sulfatase-like hydrolase/transferase [Gemmatimonadota bacterium]
MRLIRRALPGASKFAATSVSLFGVLLLARIYEYFLVSSHHVMPVGAGSLMALGLRSDAALALWLAALLAIPVIALAQWSPRSAMLVHRSVLVVVTLAGILLVQYFATTFVPLGADLFGYSIADIRETAGTGGDNKLMGVLALLVFGAVSWLLSGLAARLRLPTGVAIALGAAMLGSVLFSGQLALKPASFSSDAAFYLADNKTVFFTASTLGFLDSKRHRAAASSRLTGFPLLHAAEYDDVLGPFFKIGPRRPNIVIILVEGLGRDFTGENARYRGFMPFLDSLGRSSLYWENFLSTAGRSFGAIPSILGSLPFGEDGFMELGPQMPGHISLVSLLKKQGYTTSYYSGTDGHFDNIDVFLENEGIDHFVDQSKFGAGYVKQEANGGGFSWGYPDGEVFRRGLAGMGPPSATPRLEFYATITSHEPFVPPNAEAYLAKFERRVAQLRVPPDRMSEFRKYSGVFSTLLYTDDAIRFFIDGYSKRADFDNTIFIITGDHRLVPIPEQGRLDRYHVPLIVFSPMLKRAQRIASVSSHLDITPSLLALLHHDYGMTFPSKVSWLSNGLDTAEAFRSVHSLALMRTKNELKDYLDKESFISRDQTFAVHEGLKLSAIDDPSVRKALSEKLDRFKELNRFVTSGNHLYPGQSIDSGAALAIANDDSVFAAMGLKGKTPDAAFKAAQQLAWKGDYEKAQHIARELLRSIPNFHDARALLGRTYAWQHNYARARITLAGLVERAPEYLDGHVALVDTELWSGHAQQGLAAADSGLARFPKSPALLLGRARALEALGRKQAALKALDALRAVDPNNAAGATMRLRLAR